MTIEDKNGAVYKLWCSGNECKLFKLEAKAKPDKTGSLDDALRYLVSSGAINSQKSAEIKNKLNKLNV